MLVKKYLGFSGVGLLLFSVIQFIVLQFNILVKKLFYSTVEMECCNHNISCIYCVQIDYPHFLFKIFFKAYNLSTCSLKYNGYDSNLILRIVVHFFLFSIF